MPVLINYNMCDRAAGCPVIKLCPTGAWSYSEERKRPVVDNSKCDDCKLCIKGCPARVVLFALTEEGLSILEEEIKADPRTEEDIFKERFNSDPVDPSVVVTSSNFKKEVLDASNVVFVDFWAPAVASRCKIGAIPYGNIALKGYDVTFKKVNIDENQELAKKFDVMAIPALVVFYKGKVVDRIYGIQTTADEGFLKKRLSSTLDKIKT